MLTVRSIINIASQTVPPIIPVVQGDTGRAILFTLADFTIPAGATATYYVQKPSGEAVYNNATIDGNNVLVNLTAQSIIEKGDNYGQVRIAVGEDVVTSFDFILLVKEFRGIDAVQSLTEMNIFDKAVEQAADAIDEVKTDALEAIDDAKDEAIEEVTSNFDLKLDTSSTKGVQNQVITQAINTVNNAIGDLSGETVTPTATNNYGVGGNVGQAIETWATTEYWHGIYAVTAGNRYAIQTVSDYPQQIVVWFTNSSNVILEIHKAFATDHVEMVCTAPTGATKLFVMSYGYDAYHGTVQKVEPLSETVSNLKEDLDEYINGLNKTFSVEQEGSHTFNVSMLKGVPYIFTNNTSAVAYNLKVLKTDETTETIDTSFNVGESVTYTPVDNKGYAVRAYYDGVGVLDVKGNYKNYNYKITPELYGAVGDGVTNDTTALQNAINACITNNLPLYLDHNSVYAIGAQIRITNPPSRFHIFGNGSTIKILSGYSLSSWSYAFYFTQTNNSYADMNYFQDFKIDCNETCCGIQVDHGYDFTFENVGVRNCKTVAINAVSGGECYFNNIAIKCVHNSGNSTGLQIQSSDYHFTDVVIIDADRAVYNASSSMYTRVHAWNTSGCANTYYFVHNSGYPVLVQCHADTYETSYYRETDRPLLMVGCVFYINSNLYDSEAVPVVFKFTESSVSYSGNIKCIDCMFDALRTTVDMTESAHRIQLINCSKKGTINRFYNGVSLSLSNGVLDSGLTVNRNTITQDGDKMSVKLVLDVSAITFDGSAKSIGSIPLQRFYPSAFVVYPCWFCNDDWGTNYISGYISINNNNGIVQVKPNTVGTYKKLVADFYYDKPLNLYES